MKEATPEKQPKLIDINIVLIARNHNPKIATADWIQRKGIINEAALNQLNTVGLSVYESEKFNLVVDPDRLQIALKNIEPGNIDALQSATEEYVKALPETPYKATGFNYQWRIQANDTNWVRSTLSKIFKMDEPKAQDIFSKNDYTLGGVLCFSHNGAQVKIEVIPTMPKGLALTIPCNFHFETNGSENVLNTLTKFKDCYRKAESIVSTLFG